ncbi:MAG TPA: hypothetical protein VF407_14840, partial [Polyangiaceae bacterium]
MGTGAVVAIVVGAVLFLLLGVMTPLLVRASKKRNELVAAILEQAKANGERILIAPTSGSYEGSTDGAYGKVAGT